MVMIRGATLSCRVTTVLDFVLVRSPCPLPLVFLVLPPSSSLRHIPVSFIPASAPSPRAASTLVDGPTTSPPVTGTPVQSSEEPSMTCSLTSHGIEIADSLTDTGSLEFVEDKLLEVSVSVLKDTGADWNLVSRDFVANNRNLFLPYLASLPRPIRFDTASGKGSEYMTQTVVLPLRLHDHFLEEVFAVAPLGIKEDIILGLPWLRKYCPEAIETIEKF